VAILAKKSSDRRASEGGSAIRLVRKPSGYISESGGKLHYTAELVYSEWARRLEIRAAWSSPDFPQVPVQIT
jgi:hypothetical protein